jgi:hypothetical protein
MVKRKPKKEPVLKKAVCVGTRCIDNLPEHRAAVKKSLWVRELP